MDTRQLIPAEASIVFGFELDPVRSSPLGPLLHMAAQSESDLSAIFAAVPNCPVDLVNLRGLFAGVLDRDEKFLAVVESPGIGTEANVKCIETEMAKAMGKSSGGLLLFKTRGDVRIVPQEGGGHLIILNKNTLVVMDPGWESAVFDAIEKPEKRNTDGALAKAVQKIDLKTDLWLAASLTEAQRAPMAEIKGADGVQAVSVLADFATGMKLEVALDTRDAANAGELKASLDEALANAKPGLTATGLPENLLDTLSTATSEARVSAKIEFGKDALPGLLAGLAPFFAAEE